MSTTRCAHGNIISDTTGTYPCEECDPVAALAALRERNAELMEGLTTAADLAEELRCKLDADNEIIAADDKLAAAMRELGRERDKHKATLKLYDAQRVELANVNREAARWKKKSEQQAKRIAELERAAVADEDKAGRKAMGDNW